MSITKTELTLYNGKDSLVKEAFDYLPHEYWVVALKNEISPGSYKLQLTFNGSLTRNIVGFYRSIYKDVSTGNNRFVFYTA